MDLLNGQLDPIRKITQRASFSTEKVIAYALTLAGELGKLTPEHLFLSICGVDPGLISRLRKVRVDIKDLLAEVRAEMGRAAVDGRRSGEVISLVLKSASDMAPPGTDIGTPHLFVAMLLEESNRVSRYLRERGVDIRAFIRNRFPYISARPGLLRARRHQSPEAKARAWLWRLIPEQGARYFRDGVVEIQSRFYPCRVYRIHRENCGTEIYEQGTLTATACMHTVDSSIPPTDRVIAEYYLLKGVEDEYLNRANINRAPLK